MRGGSIILLAAAALAAAGCGDGKCEDADEDGFCAEPDPICDTVSSPVIAFCYTPPADCNDDDPNIHPYAIEKPNDGIDQDCNGVDATETCDGITDADLDGLRGCADPDCADQCATAFEDRCKNAMSSSVGSAPVTLSGTLPAGLDTMQPSCFSGQWSEQVFRITPGKAGEIGSLHLSVFVNAVGFSVRESCKDASTEIACFTPLQTNGPTLVVKGGEPLDVIVDGDANYNTSVPIALTASFDAAVCGDGTRTLPEECDDGALADGDGCSAKCLFEPAFHCAAAKPITTGYLSVDVAFDAPNGFTGSCTGKDLPERVFVFTPEADGQVAVGVQSSGVLGIHARSACADAATELGCGPPQGGVTTLTTQAKTGEPIWFFVDGDYLPFQLTTVFFPAK